MTRPFGTPSRRLAAEQYGLGGASALFDLMPQLGWVADAEGWVHYFNPRWYEYTGTTPAQMVGWGWQAVHDPALLPGMMERWRTSLATSAPFQDELPLRRHDGAFRWFMTHATPVRDIHGRVIRWIGIHTDTHDAVVERRAESDARRDAEVAGAERTRLFMGAPAAAGIFRGEALVTELANERLLAVIGAGSEIVGKPLLDAVPELSGQALAELLLDVLRTGSPSVRNETPARGVRSGKVEPMHFNFVCTPTRSASGTIDGVAVFGFDVTPLVVARQRATLGASIGPCLVAESSLAEQLTRCCEALVEVAGAAFARCWTFNAGHQVLELRASAGMYTHIDGAHARVPLGEMKIGRIAASRTAHLTNEVVGDPEVADQEWAKREGMLSFAGFPLVVGDRLVGVMALFAKHELTRGTLDALASVADQIALGIERDAAERFRELFIGMLGHDLRNPLNAVNMGAHLLLAQNLEPPQRRTLERVKNSADRMTRMIAQVLDFTRVRSGGGIPLAIARANVHEICAQAIDELASAHPERQVEASYRGDGVGEWDADRLAQVLSNVIANALAYGAKEAPVRIDVDAGATTVECSIHNLGVPIPDALVPSLFDPFRRATNGKTTATQGLGLGLFISKQIVVAHGGTLEVASSEEDGTRFTMCLPKVSFRRCAT